MTRETLCHCELAGEASPHDWPVSSFLAKIFDENVTMQLKGGGGGAPTTPLT